MTTIVKVPALTVDGDIAPKYVDKLMAGSAFAQEYNEAEGYFIVEIKTGSVIADFMDLLMDPEVDLISTTEPALEGFV